MISNVENIKSTPNPLSVVGSKIKPIIYLSLYLRVFNSINISFTYITPDNNLWYI